MKKLYTTIIVLSLFVLVSCEQKQQDEGLKKELIEKTEQLKELETKLTATEAQLMNIQAELSRYKASDSLKSVVE